MRVELERLASEIVDSLELLDPAREHASAVRLVGGVAYGVASSLRRTPRLSFTFRGDVVLVVHNPVEHGARFSLALWRALSSVGTSTVFADARHADAILGEVQDLPGVGLRSIQALGSLSRLRMYLRLRKVAAVRDHLRRAANRLAAEVAFLSQSLRYQAALDTDFSPALVVTDFDRGASARPWVWAANVAGMSTVTALHGSPSSATYLPILAHSVLAWGSTQSAWLDAHHPDVGVRVVGRADVAARAKVSGDVDRLVICHSREELLPAEQQELVAMIRALRRFGADIVLRQHPSVRGRLHESWRPIQELSQVVSSTGQSLTSFLGASDFVVGVSSTALVDALISGHGVAVVAAHSRSLPADLDAIAQLSPTFAEGAGRTPVILSQGYIEQLESLSKRLVAAVGAEAARATSAAVLELAGLSPNLVVPDPDSTSSGT